MEEYLFSLGLYKKAIAKDGSSLFRAVSEQLFFTQVHSFKIQQHCADFIERNTDFFEKLTDEDLDSFLEKIRNPKDYPGPYVLNVLSQLYKKNFMIYQELGEPPLQVVENEREDTVVLASTDGIHYDTVYPKSHLSASAFCQSIVYEVLYKRVFKFGDSVDVAVSKMLHDKAYSKQRRSHLLNQSFVECFKLDDSEEDRQNEEQDAETEIKKALAQGIPPFPYKVAKALDPQIYRNVDYDIWNEKRKEQMKNEQLVTPDIAPGVKCLVRLHDDQKDPFVAYIQELSTEQGPVTVYIEELCKRYTLPLNFIEVLPVPAYKVMWQSVRQYRGFLGCPRSPGHEKSKGKKKYIKKGTLPNYMCITSPGSSLHDPEQAQKSPADSCQRSRNNFGNKLPHNDNTSFRSGAQQYKWKNRQCDTSFFKSQSKFQNQNENILAGNKNVGLPTNFVREPTEPEVCHGAPYVQPWRQPSQVFQTSPIAIPLKTADHLRRSQAQDIPVATALKDFDWCGEANSLAGSPNGFSPLSFLLTSVYPCDAVSCVPSEYSPLSCDTNSPPTFIPSPQIPVSQPVAVPHCTDEVSAAVQASGSPLALYPYPFYTGMLMMYGDGSVHPVSVSSWRPEYPSIENSHGVTGVYYNGLGSSPSCISPPLTQWVPAPHAGYGTHWASPGSALPTSAHPGDVGYPTTVYGSPPWSPPSGYVVPQTQVAYQMPPGHPQFLPVQAQMRHAGQKPPA